LKFGVSLAGFYDTPNYFQESIKVAKQIESLGFDSVWTGDSQMLHRDAYCDLALWAANTNRIRLGPCVSNPYTRHPSVTASAILSIDEISDGRAILGIGVGDSSVRRIGVERRPVAELEQSVGIIRELCNGKSVNFEGQPLKIRWGRPRHIPIYLAATGPKTLQLAGRIADGVIMHTGTTQEGIKLAFDNIEKGAKAEKREFQKIDLVQFLFTSINQNREQAIKEAKPFVTWYLVTTPDHPLVKSEKLDPETVKRITEFRANYYQYDESASHHSASWEESSREAAFVPDDLVEKYTIAGTPEDFVRKLKKLEESGIKSVIFRPPYTDNFEDTLQLLGQVSRELRD
jgi:5,10-methylenetetrahydromethanopterin reductase